MKESEVILQPEGDDRQMGRDDETSVGTVFFLIYLSENCQKGSSTKYPFVIMSV